MGPTRRSERERAMQWPVAASTAPVGREPWKSPARPMGAPRCSMANGRPAGEQDDMEASVAMADSLAEGVPDVCRSLADDERIRSRLPSAGSRVLGHGGCWPVRFPHAHARPCSGQLAAVAHVWYRVGWFPLETVSMWWMYYQAGGRTQTHRFTPPPAALQGAPIRHGSEPRRARRLLLWQRAAHTHAHTATWTGLT
ncbi:hypothetical protein COCHEDRAFT_1150746 [Bipolaris maydis C5]|uniref:Uncharacterized protein n=1 Tax=Cochliobolus heterostrophus (strain C5 / ATCC 48332 / race O) TaxID=701091 RepID=M2VAV2_COCH5|nr:hypothetical protein COCHEDRAFT_1150746 [Bipolaris maydis C5]